MKSVIVKMSLTMLFAACLVDKGIAKTNLAELDKELEIMTSILHTSLRQDGGDKGIRVRKLDATYLAGQGIVFDIATTGVGRGFVFEFDGLFNDNMIPPIPPVPDGQGKSEFNLEIITDNWSEHVEESVERARELAEQARERLRELRQQQREFAWQQRDYERRKRDIEFEMRSADQPRLKQLQQELQTLEADITQSEEKRTALERNSQQLERQQEQQAAERAAKKQQQVAQFISTFERNLTDSLCKYGAGINALPQNENVSFVLKNIAEHDADKDKIYVFRHKDIEDCVRNKIKSDQLLAKSENYNF